MGIRLCEGQRVAYVGHDEDGYTLGDLGVVLSAGESGSHIKWTTGQRAGSISLVSNLDVAAQGRSIEPEVQQVALHVQSMFDRRGARGLVTALMDEGVIDLTGVLDEVMGSLASRVRQDPTVQEVVAHLDEDDAEAFVGATVASLLDQMREEAA